MPVADVGVANKTPLGGYCCASSSVMLLVSTPSLPAIVSAISFRGMPRSPAPCKVEPAGGAALRVGDAEPLGRDIVHTVTNPIEKLTGAIHVYGGDFFAVARSEWDPETLSELPYDMQRVLQMLGDQS